MYEYFKNILWKCRCLKITIYYLYSHVFWDSSEIYSTYNLWKLDKQIRGFHRNYFNLLVNYYMKWHCAESNLLLTKLMGYYLLNMAWFFINIYYNLLLISPTNHSSFYYFFQASLWELEIRGTNQTLFNNSYLTIEQFSKKYFLYFRF